jgi:uncharacterized protein YjbI with pentapeptide repeats
MGVRLVGSDLCLGHTPPPDRAAYLRAAAEAGDPLDFRGIALDDSLIKEGLDIYAEIHGVKKLPGLLLDAAEIRGDLPLRSYEIPGGIIGPAAIFRGRVDLRNTQIDGLSCIAARFSQGADFTGAQISGNTDFRQARMLYLDLSEANFYNLGLGEFLCLEAFIMSGAHVSGMLSAQGAQFHGQVIFDETQTEHCDFSQARFGSGGTLPGETEVELPASGSDAHFRHAEFLGLAEFSGAHFGGGLNMSDCRFNSDVSFSGAKFDGLVHFQHIVVTKRTFLSNADFSEDVSIVQCQFRDVVVVIESHFRKVAHFQLCIFGGVVDAFYKVQFDGEVSFQRSEFAGELGIDEVVFGGPCSFERVTFGAGIMLRGVVFSTDVRWDRVRIGTLQDLTIVSRGSVSLDYAYFPEGIHLIICAQQAFLRNTRFERTSSIGVCGCEVVLDGANFTQPATLYYRMQSEKVSTPDYDSAPDDSIDGPVQPGESLHMTAGAEFGSARDAAFQPHALAQPRLLSVRYSNVSQLTIVDVNLSSCRFEGAQSLDAMTIEGTGLFDVVPQTVYQILSRKVRVQLRARRQIIAEETIWRRDHRRSIPLRRPSVTRLKSALGTVEASRIAALYRALRKSRELMKDEPGAADFYYGEMEMRRHSKRSSFSERFILFLYWITAGYGLRGSRSIICLLALTLAATVVLQAAGFVGRSPPVVRIVLAATAMIGRIPFPNTPPFTSLGDAVRLTLGLIGPVLLGLLLLSIRNRLKR